ncbi:MAG TPA: carbohydrate binding domain-containing protein [Bryobacteraceae bacterium]|nr:carbohydrate binding domain-containing protein [Bryobacteraceae bacterium]
MSQRIKTTTLAVLLLGLLSAYVAASVRTFLAHRAAASNTVSGLETAVRLAPWNADYALLLARSRTLGLLDFPRGIAEYRRSLALNPYSSRGWLDLAAAYQMAGDARNQRLAMQTAVQVDPTTPSVAWEVATFYIVQGDVQSALPHYRTVLRSQSSETRAVLDVLWPASAHNAAVILADVLPPDVQPHLEFLRFAVEQKDINAANQIWQKMITLSGPVDVGGTLPYFQLLLDSHHPDQAMTAWKQLAASQPSINQYQPTPDNLIINGDFEDPMLGGGLEWSFRRQPNLDLKVDSLEFHSGNRSLAAIFDQGSAPSLGIAQLVPVEPGGEYDFSVFAKSDEITTASGPRICISDAYSGQRYFLSDDQRGTTGWKEIRSVFRLRPETTLLKVEVIREPNQALIRGKLYLDDFTLRAN